ncbi:MAG: MBL fold metallo-hydrolase [Acidobacteriota bacterium]
MGPGWGTVEAEGVTGWWGRARLFTYALRVYAYAVDDVLVDAASYSLRKPFWAYFARRLPRLVVLTHLHEDHCGNAAALAARGVRVLAPAASLAQAGVEPRLPLYRRLIWGRRPPFPAAPLPPRVETGRHTLQVLSARGHTSDHVVFYEEREGWLFTGDFYLTPRPRLVFRDEDLSATVASLETLEGLPFRILYDAHEGPLSGGPALLRRKREYLLSLRDRVEDLRRRGLSDAAIDRRLFPRKPLITYVSRGEWSSLQMVRTLGRDGG